MLHSIEYLIHKDNNTNQQELIIEKVRSLVGKDKSTIRLLIVVSVISNYRAEFSGAHTLSERQQRLYQFMRKLSGIAQTYGIAVVVTNQVNYSLHPDTPKPTGGNIMAHASTYRISLRCLRSQHNDDNEMVAKIFASPYYPENGPYFMISEKGIERAEEII